MANESAQDRFQSLVDGFNALTEEYQRVWAKSQALERGLLAARSEVRLSSHSLLFPHTVMKHLALDLKLYAAMEVN